MGINVRDNLEVLPNARQYVEMESELEMNNVIIKINQAVPKIARQMQDMYAQAKQDLYQFVKLIAEILI